MILIYSLALNLTYPKFAGIDLEKTPDILSIVGWAYALIVGISGFAAFVMLVWGGVQWMSSAGNPGAIGEAKNRMTSALLGLLLVLSSFLILQVINPDLVGTLSLPSPSSPR